VYLNRFVYSKALAAARNSDYAHPGEEENIDQLLAFFPEDRNIRILDFGCGLGGTLNYISQKGYKNLFGYDKDESSIKYCQEKFGNTGVFVNSIQSCDKFDLIVLINVMYLIEAKFELINELEHLSNDSAQILVSDFFAFRDPALQVRQYLPYMIDQKEITQLAERTHWRVSVFQDITDNYYLWYQQFIEKIKRNKDTIKDIAGIEYYEYMLTKYSILSDKIFEREIGGSIILFSR
jgi:cyclopropane fatty-acyl-phospholipid synthase-like methyltransferase